MLKTKYNNVMIVMSSAVLLIVASSIVSSAASSGYSGKVTKYKDYESSYIITKERFRQKGDYRRSRKKARG